MTKPRSFAERLRYERDQRGWSQAELAEKVACDAKTIGRWEGGESVPRHYSRQRLSEVFGISLAELGLTAQEYQQASPPAPSAPQVEEDHGQAAELAREDWGEAPYISQIYGREQECAELGQWLEEPDCRMGAIIGMGGVGKTAIATTVARQHKGSFQYVFWRSLQNTPPLEHFLRQCIGFISRQQHFDLPAETNDQILLLIEYLRKYSCLLVLDNFESLLEPGQHVSRYRETSAAYGQLLQRVGEAQHQSFLLITSREKPKEFAPLEGKNRPVRSLALPGLQREAGRQMLQDHDLIGSDEHWQALINNYAGNPLALQLVSRSIQAIFAGRIDHFLQQETIVFGDINELIDQQFRRLSVAEQEMMYWLAIEREAVSLDDLSKNLVHPLIGTSLAALESLLRRVLIEKRDTALFALQPVIMEYVTADLIERASEEFIQDTAVTTRSMWMNFSFMKAQAKDYVRESQRRLILTPVAERLLEKFGRGDIEQKCARMLELLRQSRSQARAYLAGNVLNMLIHLQYDLRHCDFSRLFIRQAFLQDSYLPGVNFAQATFAASVFTNTFGNALSLAFSPDEHRIVTGTATGAIYIYDALTGNLLVTCDGHTDGVWSLSFSPDGSTFVSSGDDGIIGLWDVRTGKCLKTLSGHAGRVRAVAFSPDGQSIASGSDDQTARIWDVKTGECSRIFTAHTGRVWAVAFNPQGDILATGSTDQSIRLWHTASGECVRELGGSLEWIRSLACSPGGGVLASGSDDGTIRIWDLVTGQCLNVLKGHLNRVWSIAFSPDGSLLASGSEDHSVLLWNVKSGVLFKNLVGHNHGVRCVSFSSDGSLLASGGDDQTIRFWDAKTGQSLKTIRGYTNRVWSAAFSSDGQKLVSCGEDQVVRFWDTNTGQCLRLLSTRDYGVREVAFSPDDTCLLTGGEDHLVRLWNVQNGLCLKTLPGHTNWLRSVAFSPDGRLLASGGEDRSVRLWDSANNYACKVLQDHTNWIRSVVFSPDGRLLASGSDDNTVRLWASDTGLCLHTLQGHKRRVRSVAFHPNGTLLASGSEDHKIFLWNTQTGQHLAVLSGHTNWVLSVAFHPAGEILASGSDDHTIRLWNLESATCFMLLQGHSKRIRKVVFHPDGQTLASSSDDGTIRFWDVRNGNCSMTLIAERPYEGMNIADIKGLTRAEIDMLVTLGADYHTR